MITDYESLKNEIIEYLGRPSVVDMVPSFIRSAELKINRRLRVSAMEARVETPLVGQLFDLPPRLLELRDIWIDSVPIKKLTYRTPQQLKVEYGYAQNGPVEAYTIVDGLIKLNAVAEAETEEDAPDLVLSIYQGFEPLSATNPTNWLITDASDLLLYGALLEAEAFVVDERKIVIWREGFTSTMKELNRMEDRKRFSGDALQMRAETRGDYSQPIPR